MNYEIRAMKSDDGQKVLSIFEEGIAGGNATFEQSAPSWEVWDSNHFNFSRFVLEDYAENVVGWCALKPFSNRDCYRGVAEVSIYLSGSVQNKGLGSMMLQKLILDSEEHGIWMLQAGIFPENTPSIIVHEKFGFRRVGTREKIAELKGVWRDILLLERRSTVVGI